MTLKALADIYGATVSVYSIRKRAARERWTDKRVEWQEKTKQASEAGAQQVFRITREKQAETRARYAIRARKLADAIVSEGERLVDAAKATSMDLSRLATALRACEQVEFVALGIPNEVVHFPDDDADGKVATWEELMRRTRDEKQLAPYTFSR